MSSPYSPTPFHLSATCSRCEAQTLDADVGPQETGEDVMEVWGWGWNRDEHGMLTDEPVCDVCLDEIEAVEWLQEDLDEIEEAQR